MIRISLLPIAILMMATIASADVLQLDLTAQDPAGKTELALRDPLYLRVGYVSETPLRFRLSARRDGGPLEFGLASSAPSLHEAGQSEALAWLHFDNPTRIDTVRVTVLDADWEEVESRDFPLTMAWHAEVAEPRTPADWVTALRKTERRERDFTFDPNPKPEEAVRDTLFLISIVSAPLYLLLQFLMLRKYTGRWHEMAGIPVVTLAPLVFFSILGFGLDAGNWASFLLRCAPFALAFLLVLGVIKFLSSRRACGTR